MKTHSPITQRLAVLEVTRGAAVSPPSPASAPLMLLLELSFRHSVLTAHSRGQVLQEESTVMVSGGHEDGRTLFFNKPYTRSYIYMTPALPTQQFHFDANTSRTQPVQT